MSKEVVRNINININGKEVVNSFTGISKAMRQTHRDIANLNRNDADYQQQLAKHRETLSKLRDEYSRAREEIGRVPQAMKKVNTEMKDLAINLVKGFSIGAVIGKTVAEFNAARETIMQFDQAQADLAGVLEKSKKEIKELTEDAKRYGQTTSFTASEVSTLQLELAKLGKTEEEIKAMTKGVLDAAVALDAELGPAAELVGGQLNSFGENASQAQRYADVMANSANISATGFESLATALPKVSAVASQSGVTFERLNGVLAVLADQNVAAETSGTGFRNILLTSAKEGKHYEEMLQRVKNSTDATKTATELFGKENATVAVILANNFDKVEEATRRLENSVGAAAALAETKLDSVTGAQKLFNSAWEGMILAMDDGDGVISMVTTKLYDMGTAILQLITPSNDLTDALINEQTELNYLIRRITDVNTNNNERVRLIDELKKNYPAFISYIDNEDFSNANLLTTLRKVNDSYRERIKLQQEIQKLEDFSKVRDAYAGSAVKTETDLYKELVRIQTKYNHNYAISQENLAQSANDYISVFGGQLNLAERRSLKLMKDNLNLFQSGEKEYNALLEQQRKEVQKTEQSFENTEFKQRQQIKNITDYNKKLEEAVKLAKQLGGVAGKDFSDMNLESVQGFIDSTSGGSSDGGSSKSKSQEKAEKAAAKKRERELAAEVKKQERLRELFERGEREIDEILQRSTEQRDLARLNGLQREEQQITNRFAKEIEKYKDHTDRIKELEAARDAEIEEARRQRSEEYRLQAEELEEQNRIAKKEQEYERLEEEATSYEERQYIMLEKAREIALMELEIEREKELAKVEAVEGAEQLKAQIRERYTMQEQKIRSDYDKAERTLRSQQVDWTKLTEEEKLNHTKAALSGAAEAFNEGSGAWKATKIAETVISTYQSATSAFNSLSGIPIVGPALGAAAAALAVVTGLKNVQKISNTPLQKMPTYYYGGHTGNTPSGMGGDEYGQFTGSVHANEWVSPAFMTQSPRYAPIIDWLENERQLQLNGVAGSNSNPFFDHPVFNLLTTAVVQLNENVENGIVAKSYFGYEEIEKMEKLNKELQQAKQNAIIS